MKYIILAVLFQLLIVWSLTSCKKQDIRTPLSSSPCDNCRIEALYQILKDDGSAVEKVGTFYYDELNRPVFFEAFNISEVNPDMAFIYDNKGRLTDFIRQYRNGTFETWNAFKYNDSNKIVADSGYLFGHMNNGRPAGLFSRWATFMEFDAKGRVTKEYSKNKKGQAINVVTYSYDVQGNRTGNTYDTSININRLSPAFQLINREYSVNNITYAGVQFHVNDKGLPLELKAPDVASVTFLDIYSSSLRIDYYCK